MKKIVLINIITLFFICGCASNPVYLEYDVNLKKVIFCDQETLENIYKLRGGDISLQISFDGRVAYSQLLGFYCPDIQTAYILYLPERPLLMHQTMGHELFRAMGFKDVLSNGRIDLHVMEEDIK